MEDVAHGCDQGRGTETVIKDKEKENVVYLIEREIRFINTTRSGRGCICMVAGICFRVDYITCVQELKGEGR